MKIRRGASIDRVLGGRRAWWLTAWLALAMSGLALGPSPARATPFIWDQDTDGIDDRIESVNLLGYSYSFQDADTLARQRIVVTRGASALEFGVYVIYDHDPTSSDLLALTGLGIPVLRRYESAPAVRAIATFPQIQAAAALQGVQRVEAVPVLYPEVREGAAAIGMRDPSERVFPTWEGSGGPDGSGVSIAFLDTGINDAPDGSYPGHESLAGRFLGGASFVNGDSLADTPLDGSTNPEDRGGQVTHSHGTHVAGIALGSGGASGYARGVAPGARFVDVKVLTDAGSGTAVADGLDWCIHNRARDWGVPGYAGIQVINLSLSSPDQSDGNDLVAQLADRAVELGIVVVASAGNDGQSAFIPSPAGASRALAVTAIDVQRTPAPEDDRWATFANSGPRASNGDGGGTDEQKPDLAAPGVAVLSADGSLASDGASYQRLSGTSMAAAFVSGAAAVLRSANPALAPDQIADLLRSTARRDVAGAPAGPAGPDSRWNAALGFGVVDLYAARLELLEPAPSQIEGLELAAGNTSVSAVIRTQRERGAAWFALERAPDVNGAPGAFAGLDSVAAAGDSSLAISDRHAYPLSWSVPPSDYGVSEWYRVAFTENGTRHVTASRRFTNPSGPPLATLVFTVVHDAYDHDITGLVSAAASGGALSLGLPGTSAADSSDWVNGESTTGTVAWSFHLDVPAGSAAALLPPSASHPWWLRLDDGGYLNRSGRLVAYRLIWHTTGGDVAYEGGPLPLPTLEGQSVYASVPQTTAGIGPQPRAGAELRFGPNPVPAGGRVRFSATGSARALEILDLAGRRVARLPLLAGSGERSTAQWRAVDAAGHPLPPGVYLARAGARQVARIVVVR